jgi:hypothetical protein
MEEGVVTEGAGGAGVVALRVFSITSARRLSIELRLFEMMTGFRLLVLLLDVRLEEGGRLPADCASNLRFRLLVWEMADEAEPRPTEPGPIEEDGGGIVPAEDEEMPIGEDDTTEDVVWDAEDEETPIGGDNTTEDVVWDAEDVPGCRA